MKRKNTEDKSCRDHREDQTSAERSKGTALVKMNLKEQDGSGALGDVMDQVVEVKGVKVLARNVDGVDMNGLRDLGDQLKDKLGEGVVVLASVKDGKVSLLAMATDAATEKALMQVT